MCVLNASGFQYNTYRHIVLFDFIWEINGKSSFTCKKLNKFNNIYLFCHIEKNIEDVGRYYIRIGIDVYKP